MTKFKTTRKVGNRFQNPPRQTASVWGPVQCHRYTDFFTPAHPPVGQKTSPVNFKHKVTTSADYCIWTALVQDILLTTKKCVCMVKELKNNFKSINQIRPVLMLWWNVGGGELKQGGFSLKTSYKLGTDKKRGEQVGFLVRFNSQEQNWSKE